MGNTDGRGALSVFFIFKKSNEIGDPDMIRLL